MRWITHAEWPVAIWTPMGFKATGHFFFSLINKEFRRVCLDGQMRIQKQKRLKREQKNEKCYELNPAFSFDTVKNRYDCVIFNVRR